jgi:hypothetical protein
MPKYPAAWFVQHKVPQGIILGDPFALFPQRLAWRRGNPTNNYIANFAFGVARNGMYNFGTTHA